MASEIEKEAKERRERRAKSGRQADDSLLPSLHRSPELKQVTYGSYRSSRTGLNGSGNDVSRTTRDIISVDQPMCSPKRMSLTPRQSSCNYASSSNKMYREPLCLPFIECQIHGVKVKALLNTCVVRSIINRSLHKEVLGADENKFVPSAFDIARGVTEIANNVPITIATHRLCYDFQIRGNIPDVVLGLDFLTAFNCSINLGPKTLSFHSDGKVVTSKFLNDKEILSKSKSLI